MKSLHPLFCMAMLLFLFHNARAGSTCRSNGNVVIYSNYDGGILTINVDQNIPNLKIGICTYEPIQVTITGTYKANVTQIMYAGFNSNQNNNNCGQGNFTTSITGVSSGIISINEPNDPPQVGYTPAHGNGSGDWGGYILGVAGLCDTLTDAGGGNTPDEVVYYFLNAFNGALLFHHTQYACWRNETLHISDGGNCCIEPSVAGSCITPAAAGTIIGAGTVCQGQTASYSVAPVVNATGYNWVLPAGLTITNGADSNVIEVLFSSAAQSGNITVQGVNTCGNGASSLLAVTVNAGVSAGSITARDGSLCAGGSDTLQVQNASAIPQWQSSVSGAGFTDINGVGDSTYTALFSQTTYFRAYVSSGTCSDTSPVFTLTVYPVPASPALQLADSIICSGDSTLICVDDPFATYRWNTGAQSACIYAKAAGGYRVDVTDQNGCTATSSRANVATYPVMSVSVIVKGDTLSSFNASAYQWYRNDTVIDGATNSIYIVSQTGNYAVQVTDVNGCVALSTPINVQVTSVAGLSLAGGVQVYPNPVQGTLYVRLTGADNGTSHLHMINSMGATVMDRTIPATANQALTVDVSALAAGIYFVQVQTGSALVTTKVMVADGK